MRNVVIVAVALVGLNRLLERGRAAMPRPLPPRPPTTREYHDRLAHLLEVAASHGNGPMWDEVSEECRRADRGDLPGHVRKRWPELAERLDRE